MTLRSRSELENLFKTGAKPSGEDFRDFIESTLNLNDDQAMLSGGNGGSPSPAPAPVPTPAPGQQGPLTVTQLQLGGGPTINKISTDMSGNSDNAIPTEKAVRAYVDSKMHSYSQGKILSKNGTYTLILQEGDGPSKGNLVVYRGEPQDGNPIWASWQTKKASGTWEGGKPSDIKLKEDIVPLDNALSKLLSLRGVSFYWQDKEMGEDREIGVIAQEVEKVFPELVNTPVGGSKLVQYENFVPILIEAIKEQQQTISQLQQEVEKIKAEGVRAN
ncbi:MAG: tail fiber domain-containing protein [Cyanobacteria bacterium P01_F01_bin.150]